MNRTGEFISFIKSSDIKNGINSLENLWADGADFTEVLDSIFPFALSSFSHRFSSMHVPKENEYLRRFLNDFQRDEQLDFLKRYIEYLIWSPKYIVDSEKAVVSGSEYDQSLESSYLNSIEKHEGIPALHYIQKIAEDSLTEAVRTILRIGCVDVSQALGHYFSCTESMIKLALESGVPKAANHLFAATLYMMQSSPVRVSKFETPEKDIDEIPSRLIRKAGFYGYHYMILFNGLENQKEFLGDEYYLHGLRGLEKVLPSLSDGMSHDYFKKLINNSSSEGDLTSLKQSIWKGDKNNAFSILSRYYENEGVTSELKNSILHSYTLIDDHPHDPHYVTIPRSLFELIEKINPDDIILALAHTVEFACDRISSRGVIYKQYRSTNPVN